MNKKILVLFSMMFVSTIVQLRSVEHTLVSTVIVDEEAIEVEQCDQEVDLDDFVWDDDCLLDGISLEDLETIEESDMSLSDKAKLILFLAKIHVMDNKQRYIIGGVAAGVLVGGFFIYKRWLNK